MDYNKSKKIWLLITDGIGIKNFIYTDFMQDGTLEIWSNLSFLSKYGTYNPLPHVKVNSKTDIYKRALTKASLKFYADQFQDKAFLDYIFPNQYKTLKQSVKNIIVDFLATVNQSKLGRKKLNIQYLKTMRNSNYYNACRQQLEDEKPGFVFCTHQRALSAAVPILAARDLGIPTAAFIFSWDNLPKGNLAVPAEHYFVWSEYMKNEMLKYYPDVPVDNIHITGTPQFIPYTDHTLVESREVFCKANDLDPSNAFICFSGDDITTSPYDPVYLNDLAETVNEINKTSDVRYQIIFRRVPTDVSGRYDSVLYKHKNVIRSVVPIWKKLGNLEQWNAIMPTREDLKLLVNTVRYSDVVVNVGSTMALDFAILDKVACYINYNVGDVTKWNIHRIYNFIHFRSKKGLDPLYWINSKEEMKEKILAALEDKENKLPDAKKWLEIIATHPLKDANKRLSTTIESIMETV